MVLAVGWMVNLLRGSLLVFQNLPEGGIKTQRTAAHKKKPE
jgi:hypothetical protein